MLTLFCAPPAPGTGVVDVSSLGRVHTLTLAGCTGVVDVSELGGVHTLRCTFGNLLPFGWDSTFVLGN